MGAKAGNSPSVSPAGPEPPWHSLDDSDLLVWSARRGNPHPSSSSKESLLYLSQKDEAVSATDPSAEEDRQCMKISKPVMFQIADKV